jgi:hypothetical protein
MKNKGGSSLYEVLKSASRPPDAAAGAAATEATPPPSAPESSGQPTLQERLAAYKAAKLAAAVPAPMPAASLPAAEEETPAPAPVAVPPPVLESKPFAGPGERVLRLSYNNAVFAGLVVIGLLFVAYAIGVQAGKKRGLETAAVEAPAPAPFVRETPIPPLDVRRPAPPPPPPAPKEYTIRLAEWKYGTAQERLKADAAAEDFKKALDRASYRGSKKEVIQRGGEPRLALYLDTFADPSATAVKTRLASVQKLRVGTQTPFAQAQVEEAPK